MATLRQKKLAEAIVHNAKTGSKKNKKELVVSSGYSEISAESSAGILIEQKGVKEELNKLGFNVESAKKVVVQILRKGKEENRLRAAQEVFKVSGEYAPEKHLVVTKKIISVDE